MESIIIRKMREEDIENRARVHYEGWHWAYKNIIPASYLERLTLEGCIKTSKNSLDSSLVAVNERGECLGFISFGKSLEREDFGEIFGLYLLENYTNKKIGYRLMFQAIKSLSPYKNISLWLLKDNKRGYDFYKKFGFIESGKEKKINLGKELLEIEMIYERDNIGQ